MVGGVQHAVYGANDRLDPRSESPVQAVCQRRAADGLAGYEIEAIRAYDASKAIKDEAIPFEQAVSEIERARR